MENKHEQIEKRIGAIAYEAVSLFSNTFDKAKKDALQLSELGFKRAKNVLDNKLSKSDEKEVIRAKLFGFFGCMILTNTELVKFEKEYNLVSRQAEDFKDVIPQKNVDEILAFVKNIRDNKWNQGRLETELYYIPINDPFTITAPTEMFNKPVTPELQRIMDLVDEAEREGSDFIWNTMGMTKEQYITWIYEDPIVWKRIWKFDPTRKIWGQDQNWGGSPNQPTEYLAMATAWGMEELLIHKS